MNQRRHLSMSTSHPWSRLEPFLQVLLSADNRHLAAYAEAVSEVGRAVERSGSRLIGSPRCRVARCDGRDIAQEWWLRMHAFGFRKYRPELGPMHPFCYRILCNLCRDIVRKARVRRTAPLPLHLADRQPEARELAERTELRQRVKKAVQQLPRHLRLSWKLRYRRNLSSDDVARICKVSAQTVNWRIFTARAHLRRLLADALRDWRKYSSTPPRI
jgi:RNA polymerase sigma factor (sigma-70 family)